MYEFGSMAVNEEKKHTFKIRNTGEGPLQLEVGPSTCKCTVGSLSKKNVLPGEEVNVELTWKAKEVSQNFAQSATIWTSDCAMPHSTDATTNPVTAAISTRLRPNLFARKPDGGVIMAAATI